MYGKFAFSSFINLLNHFCISVWAHWYLSCTLGYTSIYFKNITLFLKFFHFWSLKFFQLVDLKGQKAPFTHLHPCSFSPFLLFIFLFSGAIWSSTGLSLAGRDPSHCYSNGLHYPGGGECLLYHWVVGQVLTSHSSGLAQWGDGASHHCWQVCKLRLPSWPLSAWAAMKPKFSSGLWLKSRGCCLNLFFLSRILLSWYFGWREEASGCYLFI